MRTTAIFMVLGVCGVLSFGCASVQKLEKEAVSVAKEQEKNGNLEKLAKEVEKKVENNDKAPVAAAAKKDDKADDKAADKKTDVPDRDAPIEKAANEAAGHGFKVTVKDGVATLTGKGAAKDKTAAEAAVKKVKGVTKVVNDIDASGRK